MAGSIIIRCGTKAVSLVEINGSGFIAKAKNYEIHVDNSATNRSEEWLRAFAKTLSKIPKKLRKKINLIIPPNAEIYVKHLQVPDVTKKNIQDAFLFECEQEFPGGSHEWSWHLYQAANQPNHAFGIAIRKEFVNQMVDILIRNKIQFSFICPEILLSAVAIKNCIPESQNSLLAYIGEEASYLSCLGETTEYFRMLPISGNSLTKTIIESQKISKQKAENLQLEFFQNTENENSAFITYYIKQFAQKLRQELKRSELFYCRIFKQAPISKIYLAGSRSQLCNYFTPEDETQIINVFDALKNNIDKKMPAEEIDIIKHTIVAFAGAAYCLKINQKNLLNLFTANFSTQTEFQRQNFGYLLIAAVVTLLGMTTLKILTKDVADFDTKRAALEAKLIETKVDVLRYKEYDKEKTELHSFISNAKLSFYSQAAWARFLADLQSRVETLQTAWIESLEWADKQANSSHEIVKFSVKMLVIDDEAKKSVAKKIEDFTVSLEKIDIIKQIKQIKISHQNDNIISFSLELELRQQSSIIVQ